MNKNGLWIKENLNEGYRIITSDEMDRVLEIAEKWPNCTIISDEIYDRLISIKNKELIKTINSIKTNEHLNKVYERVNNYTCIEINPQIYKKAFLDSRSNRRSTTLYDLTKRVELACRFLEKSPKPQNAKDLFLRIKEEYFDVAPPHKGSKKKLKNPEGGDGRKRNCGDIKSFLNYCVEKKLVNANLWTAPSSDWLQEEIIKTKATNRISSGISRYFDLKDVTGKYSSTNLYGSDGILYRETYENKQTFTFSSQTDIEAQIENMILPIIQSMAISNFYFGNYSIIIVSDLNATWVQSTKGTNTSSGLINNTSGAPFQVGAFTCLLYTSPSPRD